MLLLGGIFGLLFGSFTNVLILRDNERASIMSGRSRCPHCKKELRWFELIPVLSFLIQGGRCRRCHKPISWQYPAVELFVALLFAGIAWFGLDRGMALLPIANLMVAAVLLVAVSGVDLRTQTVPVDYVIAAGLFGALGMGLGGVVAWPAIALGLAAGAGTLAAVTYGWLLLFKKEGMGSGDIWIAGAIGAIAGFPGVFVALIAAVFSGALAGMSLIIFKKTNMEAKIPFGPFLFFGLLVAVVWGEPLIRWYTMISGFTY